MSERMQKIHDKIAECDREAALRGFSDTGFPRLWFSALSRVAGLELARPPRSKCVNLGDGSIPSPVTRDTSPAICELQQQNDELRAEIARLREERRSITTLLGKVESLEADNKRLREERRWVPVGERLPEVGVDVLATGDEGVFQARLALWGERRRWEPLALENHGCGCCGGGEPNVTHWQPLPPGPEPKEVNRE